MHTDVVSRTAATKNGLRQVGRVCPTRSRTDWVFKVACLGPGVVISVLMVAAVAALLPHECEVVAGWTGVLVTCALATKAAEPIAVRLIHGGRRLGSCVGGEFGAVIGGLCSWGLGPPIVDLFVTRRGGARDVRGVGRRSVIIHERLLADVSIGRICREEAAAVVSHAALVTASGRTRLDLLIELWSTPWRLVSSIGMPHRGLLGFAWRARAVVFCVAIVQSSATDGTLLGRLAVVGALALVLAMTYLMPGLPLRWENHVVRAADRDLAAVGLGASLASVLRRKPSTAMLSSRIGVLERPHEHPPHGRKQG